ncbi:MAG: PadR family transcriptional regulator, partial [Candidatus Saccharibacteria bacterium]
MDKKQTMDDLVNRYGMDMKKLIYPLLVLHVIKSHKKASSQEIKSEINRIAGKEVEYQYTSYYRLMSNLEHDRELIEPVELVKEKGPARIYYSLTPKGEEL